MKIEQSYVRQLKLTDVPGLDPIDVMLEDFEPGKGRITIRCWDCYWSAEFEGIDGNVASHFMALGNESLAVMLAHYHASIDENKVAIQRHVRRFIVGRRRVCFIGKAVARKLYDDAVVFEKEGDLHYWSEASARFGARWWHTPEESNDVADAYLCRIIDAVREGLKLAAAMEVPANGN